MKKLSFKYRLYSWVLLLAVMPSFVGINVFRHACIVCNESETSTSFVEVVEDSHHSECGSCCSLDTKQFIHQAGSSSDQIKPGTCSHEFERLEVQKSLLSAQFQLRVPQIQLFMLKPGLLHLSKCSIEPAHKYIASTSLYVPDEPSLVANCVFII